MKITCGSCGAKYSMADEKLEGRSFKLRCKRCSDVIVVSGDAPQRAGASVAPATATAPDRVWHVIAAGEQRGPLAPEQIGELLSASTIDWDALAWCDGMENWAALRDLAPLVAQITGVALDESAPVSARSTSRPARSQDLFAPVDATSSPFAGTDAPMVPTTSEPSMTGARNESSVLFSLSNLQALASTRPQAGARTPSAPSRTVSASRDGSGLIDIRALAAAQTGPAGAKADALLSIGALPPSFAPLLGSPVLMPAKTERSSRGLLLGVGVVTVLSVAAIAAVAVVSILRPTVPAFAAERTAPQARGADTLDVAPAALPTSAPAPPSPSPDSVPPASHAPAPATPATPAIAPPTADRRTADRRRTEPRNAHAAPAASPTAARPSAPPAPAPAHPTGAPNRDVNQVLAGLFGDRPSDSARPQPATPDATRERLPQQPDRDQVLAALRAVQADVRACGGGQHGTAMTSLSVTGATGRVSSVSVSGAFQGTPVGACVARAARDARFPHFSRQSFSVSFPFSI